MEIEIMKEIILVIIIIGLLFFSSRVFNNFLGDTDELDQIVPELQTQGLEGKGVQQVRGVETLMALPDAAQKKVDEYNKTVSQSQEDQMKSLLKP